MMINGANSMIKPILLIELPEGTERDNFDRVIESMQNVTVNQDYHIIVLTGKSEFIRVEIVTASDVSIHKP